MDPQNDDFIPGSEDFQLDHGDPRLYFGFCIVAVVACITLALLLLILVREYVLDLYNVDIYHCLFGRKDFLTSSDLAVEAIKQSERTAWYQSYLKPFTMTAKKEDLIHTREIARDSETVQVEEAQSNSCRQTTSAGEQDGDRSDLESGNADDNEPLTGSNDTKEAKLVLRLPAMFGHDIQRSVEAHCAICTRVYKDGDRVVWSNLGCKHAVHLDCIVPSLPKGKICCPTCRLRFVPRMEDQKIALAVELAAEDLSDEATQVSEIEEDGACNH